MSTREQLGKSKPKIRQLETLGEMRGSIVPAPSRASKKQLWVCFFLPSQTQLLPCQAVF